VVTAKLCALALTALVAWGLKHHYATARAEELWWILTPTARVVGVTTGTAFQAVPGEGYVSRERLFVIEKSCAGINFMIAAFVMLVLAFEHRITSSFSAARVIAAALVASYGAALAVNATRIIMAMWLAAHPVGAAMLSAAELHRLEGIAVYFAGLVILYEAALGLERRVVSRSVRP
jgi:exosortase K